MIFIPLLIVAIALYMSGKRVGATIIFFFFLMDGFQLVPEEFFNVKPKDFALVYVLVLFIWGCIRYNDFLPKNKLTLYIGIYLLFVFFIIFLSKVQYHIALTEIIRTSRHYFLVLAYFILRRMNRKDIYTVIHLLFGIFLLQCCLFITQVFTGFELLTGAEYNYFNGWIYRSYNIPALIYFFMFYALFANPFKGILRYVTAIIPAITLVLSLHRSWIVSFIFVLLLGVLIINNILNSKKNIIRAILIIIPVILISLSYLTERTITDINSVARGEFIDMDVNEIDEESTLLFRVAHFYERFLFAMETKTSALFGIGLMTEDSDYTYNKFDFIIGLDDKESDEIVQLDTSDTAWSNFIIRYGIVGTVVYMILYVYLTLFFFRRWRQNKLVLIMFLGMIFIICISLTSDELYYASMLIIPFLIYDLTKDEEINYSNITI